MPAAPTPFADPLRLPSVIDIGPHHHEAELDIDLRPTRMRLHSELPGAEFWCHVLEHEDHDMMRPLDVLPPQIDDIMVRDMPMTHAGGHGH